MIWENEKDKFEEIIKSELMDKAIGTLIEGIVFDMNKNSDFVVKYYDREEARKQELEIEKKYLREEVRDEVREEVLAEGIEQNRIEMIMNMYKKGWTLEHIADGCNLTIEEVEKIIDSNKE
ncbi:MAG: hypothetical protein IKN63_02150 [Bacilli bacterium]|nr:hypothetical protein [Bacilli bacterium]